MNAPFSLLHVEDSASLSMLLVPFLEERLSCKPECAVSFAEGVSYLENNSPDLILLDLFLPDAAPERALVELREASPRSKFVTYSGCVEFLTLHKIAKLQPEGMIHKNMDLECLFRGIEEVANGGTYRCRDTTAMLQKAEEMLRETNQQDLLLLGLLQEGLSSKEIAPRLGIGVRGVESRRQALLLKFEARNVVDLISKAHRLGILR